MHLTITGRRWFQRTYGNTYHTAQIRIDGKPIHSTPKEYGYDDQYIETAMRWLDESGLIEPRLKHNNGFHEALYQWAERTGNTFDTIPSDVSRERDL